MPENRSSSIFTLFQKIPPFSSNLRTNHLSFFFTLLFSSKKFLIPCNLIKKNHFSLNFIVFSKMHFDDLKQTARVFHDFYTFFKTLLVGNQRKFVEQMHLAFSQKIARIQNKTNGSEFIKIFFQNCWFFIKKHVF